MQDAVQPLLSCLVLIGSLCCFQLLSSSASSKQVGLLHACSHPSVVALEEVFEDESSVHIVMELCVGGDISELMSTHSNLSCDVALTSSCSERDAACIIHTVLQVGCSYNIFFAPHRCCVIGVMQAFLRYLKRLPCARGLTSSGCKRMSLRAQMSFP